MSRARITVRTLAQQAELELDEALASLWDAGIPEVLDPDDAIPPRLVTTAQRALGVTTSREMTLVRFWLDATGLDHDEFAARLATVDIDLSPRARRLPKNSLRRVRRIFPGVASSSAATSRVTQEVEIAPLKWETVGTLRPQSYLSEDEVCAIHDALVEDFSDTEDPILPAGLRDAGLLSSALARPQGVGAYKYPTLEMAGAATVHSWSTTIPFTMGIRGRHSLVSSPFLTPMVSS